EGRGWCRMDLLNRLEEHRAEQDKLHWKGTFREYVDLVLKDPAVARLSHARVYDMIVQADVETGPHGQRRYKFFEAELFGLDRPIQQLVDYFASSAKRLEVRKRILLLMGPVGGGKSTLVSILKR